MYPPAMPVLGEDIADFRGQDEMGGLIAFLQGKEPVSGGLEAQAELREVIRVGKIAGAQEVDALYFCPAGERFDIHLRAGGAAVFGMYVEVRNEFHWELNPYFIINAARAALDSPLKSKTNQKNT
jgi:hypothetical protein